MLSLQQTFSLGYWGKHQMRAALVILSIALGVATLVATRALSAGLNKASIGAINPLAGIADLLVVNGQSGVPRELVDKLLAASIPDLVDAQPVILGRVAISDLDHRSVWLLGIDWSAIGQRTGVEGRKPAAEGRWGIRVESTVGLADMLNLLGRKPVLVGSDLAKDLAKRLPEGMRRIKVLAAGGRPRELAGVGIVYFDDPKLPLGGQILVLDVADASAVIYPDRPNYVHQLNLTLAPGAERALVQQQIQQVLGNQATVETVEAHMEVATDVTAGLELGFAIGGAGALVIGLFLVYIVLSVSVAERRHDIGMLRSLGATRGQVTRLFVGEAVGLGLIGSILGLPVGYGLAWLSLGWVSRVLGDLYGPIGNAGIVIGPSLMALAVASGTVTAVLAALVPAVQAAREEPADAVRRVPLTRSPFLLALHVLTAAIPIALGVGCVALREHLPLRAGVFGGIVFILIGALVATPLLAAIIGRFVQPLVRGLFGIEERLAADNLVRAPGRTGLVIAAVAATGALMTQTAGFVRSTDLAIREWLDQKVAADLFVTAGSSLTSAGFALTMDEPVGAKLEELRSTGVEVVLPVRMHRIDFRNRMVFMVIIDTTAFDGHSPPEGQSWPIADHMKKFPRLRETGTALVSENFAALYHVRIGDHLTVPGRAGPIDLEVLGTMIDYTWNRGTILVDRSWYRQEFADSQVDIYDLFLREGAEANTVRQEIQERWGKNEALFVVTRQELNAEVSNQLGRVYILAYAQQFLIGMVAVLGVVSALFISVLQRRRELGLLRAVGASRSQVLRSVLAEAALMGLLGAALGFLIGLLLEWYVVDVMVFDEAGFTFPLRVPWFAAGIVSGSSIVLAALAGLWPAYHATRLRIPEAIAYE
jgi:putative ABC transport system permease protein